MYWPLFGDICRIMVGNLVSVSVLKLTLFILYLSSVSFLARQGYSFTSYLLELDFMAKLLSGCCSSAVYPKFCQCRKDSSVTTFLLYFNKLVSLGPYLCLGSPLLICFLHFRKVL